MQQIYDTQVLEVLGFGVIRVLRERTLTVMICILYSF